MVHLVRQRGTLFLAFVSAVLGLLAAFAAVGSTIPLFNIYRAEDGFSNADISLTVVSYSIGTISTLLVFGRLSNFVGRRAAALISLGLLIAGCLVLLNVHEVWVLIAGRLLMGLGAGMASSTLTAYIVDAAPTKPGWLASVASSQTVMLGLAIGAITSGALVQFGPWRRDLIFIVGIVFLLVSAVLIYLSPETVSPRPFTWLSLRPSVRVPARIRHLLPVAAAVILPTWATGAFYQAFVPALVEDQLHTMSPLLLGLVFASYMAPSAFGAPLGHLFTTATAQRVGMSAFFLGWVGIVTANTTGALPLFVVATVVAGVGQGVAISSATHGLLFGSNLADRAPIFAVIYLLSYGGATVPSLIAGQLSAIVSIPQIAIGYAVFALIGTAFTLIGAKNPHPPAVTNPTTAQAHP
ncbi:MFS transporter [Leifsonia xyli]|uniref:MFS transporter n=1 Tax=Leifsonia xyli TaxID=1575 RepID=UPI003D67822C